MADPRGVHGDSQKPTLLLLAPRDWAARWISEFERDGIRCVIHGKDEYEPGNVDFVFGFRPPPGLLATLPALKTVFSLGAGVDGFLVDPFYPRTVPLVRFVDDTLSAEMAQYVVLHTLLFHRGQHLLGLAQKERRWMQTTLARRTADTRIGVLGLGAIGTVAARQLCGLGFPVAGWSRTRKDLAGIESFAGAEQIAPFLARTDILICLLPLTDETRGILNAKTFARLPRGAYLINAARGGHLVEADLIPAIESGQLAGATLDVFEREPLPPESPFWSHPKITVTPHNAAISDPRAAVRMVIDGIRRQRRGEELANVVDLSRGY